MISVACWSAANCSTRPGIRRWPKSGLDPRAAFVAHAGYVGHFDLDTVVNDARARVYGWRSTLGAPTARTSTNSPPDHFLWRGTISSHGALEQRYPVVSGSITDFDEL